MCHGETVEQVPAYTEYGLMLSFEVSFLQNKPYMIYNIYQKVVLPHRKDGRGVLGFGSVPIATAPSCHYMKNNVLISTRIQLGNKTNTTEAIIRP